MLTFQDYAKHYKIPEQHIAKEPMFTAEDIALGMFAILSVIVFIS